MTDSPRRIARPEADLKCFRSSYRKVTAPGSPLRPRLWHPQMPHRVQISKFITGKVERSGRFSVNFWALTRFDGRALRSKLRVVLQLIITRTAISLQGPGRESETTRALVALCVEGARVGI